MNKHSTPNAAVQFLASNFADKYSEQHQAVAVHRFRKFPSVALGSHFWVDVYLPPDFVAGETEKYPVLIFNDGQDMNSVRLSQTLNRLYLEQKIPSLVVVAIHAGERLQEYGVASRPDYRNRGSKAGAYTQFIVNELFPFIKKNYTSEISPSEMAIAGFSLGGLSALDIAWQHRDIFGKVGVFSGSFWWRHSDFSDNDPDAHRIMHELLRQSDHKPGMKFWFQTGTHDEADDRNNNGIIDAIDDTLDIIRELTKLGHSYPGDIHYREVEGGRHHTATWAQVLPEFLVWAFGEPVLTTR